MCEELLKKLDLISPCFCLASLLTHGDIADGLLEDIDESIEHKLRLIRPESTEAIFNRAEREELEFQAAFLEYCYVRPGTTADDAPGMKKRRKEADEVCAFFNVPWSSRGLAHICAAGCCGKHNEGPCASRVKAVEKAKRLARLLLSPPVTEPAANKYTKCDPCVRSVAIVAWFHGLVRKAIGRKLKRQEESTGHAAGPAGADVVDYDAAIGVPRDAMGHERKIGGIKLNKVYYFLSHGKAK